jgi:hypothetical protein
MKLWLPYFGRKNVRTDRPVPRNKPDVVIYDEGKGHAC